ERNLLMWWRWLPCGLLGTESARCKHNAESQEQRFRGHRRIAPRTVPNPVGRKAILKPLQIAGRRERRSASSYSRERVAAAESATTIEIGGAPEGVIRGQICDGEPPGFVGPAGLEMARCALQ